MKRPAQWSASSTHAIENIPLTVFLTALAVLSFGPSATAATLSTPLVLSNGATSTGAYCDVTNVGTNPILITSVQLFDGSGNLVAFDSNSCPVPPATLPPHSSCEGGAFPPFTAAGYCTVTAGSSKIRLMLNLLDNLNNTVVSVPGTK